MAERNAARAGGPVPEDDGEKAWVDALEPLGFKFTACGTAMHFTYGTWSVLVTGDFGHAEGWEKPTGLALEVSFATAAGRVTPHLSIMDDPTVGDVKRLLTALGLSLSPPEAGR